MGKRYYCEYCDCSFPDSKESREKHRNGLNHKRFRAQYYDSLSS
jgi:U11/U12 small nuclear ribonucleoprotein SNRNP20